MVDARKFFMGRVGTSLIVMVGLMVIFGAVATVGASAQATAADAAKVISPEQATVQKFGLIAAAIAFGFGALGAGFAIANVGAAAMGAIGEKLADKGANVVAAETFIVLDTEGPLRDGEVERAQGWVNGLISTL